MKKAIIVLVLGTVATRANAGVFERCRRRGKREAYRMWRGWPFDEDCDQCWGFRDDCEDAIETKYTPYPWDSWLVEMCKNGKAAGIREATQEVDEMCLGMPDQCVECGEAAAEWIAYSFCPKNIKIYNRVPIDYQADCREVAYGECKGAMRSKVKYYCGSKPLSTSQLKILQRKCVKQVNEMVGFETFLRNDEGYDDFDDGFDDGFDDDFDDGFDDGFDDDFDVGFDGFDFFHGFDGSDGFGGFDGFDGIDGIDDYDGHGPYLRH